MTLGLYFFRHVFDTLQEYSLYKGSRVGIRDEFNGRDRVGHEEVGNLSSRNGTVIIAQSHCASAVKGGGIDGLGRHQSHLDTGKRDDELHIAGWRGTRIVIAGKGERKSAVYHLAT